VEVVPIVFCSSRPTERANQKLSLQFQFPSSTVIWTRHLLKENNQQRINWKPWSRPYLNNIGIVSIQNNPVCLSSSLQPLLYYSHSSASLLLHRFLLFTVIFSLSFSSSFNFPFFSFTSPVPISHHPFSFYDLHLLFFFPSVPHFLLRSSLYPPLSTFLFFSFTSPVPISHHPFSFYDLHLLFFFPSVPPFSSAFSSILLSSSFPYHPLCSLFFSSSFSFIFILSSLLFFISLAPTFAVTWNSKVTPRCVVYSRICLGHCRGFTLFWYLWTQQTK